MKLLYVTDAMIWHYNDRYYAAGLANILTRYYKHFGKLDIICRVLNTAPKTELKDVTDCLDSVIGVDNLAKFMILSPKLKSKIKTAIQHCDLIAIRIPAFIGTFTSNYAHKLNKPVLAEVMGCPWDSLWNHSLKGKVLAPMQWLRTKKIARNATYSHYVTEEFLQSRYPSSCDLQLAASDVIINPIDEALMLSRQDKIQNMDHNKIRLMTSAACNVKYKGQQYVIQAIKMLREKGIEAHYSVCGGGDTSFLEQEAKKYGVEDLVEFKGRLPLERIFEELDKADIYIQPSLQEGLPRALVEAMSRGCPAIGAKTGGIPELISPEYVTRRKSATDIADAIERMLENGNMMEQSKASFKRASDFESQKLQDSFEKFYTGIKREIS